jgi:hypothetical protein
MGKKRHVYKGRRLLIKPKDRWEDNINIHLE